MSQPTTGVDTEGFYDSDDFDIDDISDHLYEWAINTREFKAFTNWDDKGKTRLLSIDGPLGYRETMREWAAGCLMAASTGKTARPVYVASYFDDYTAKNAVNIAPLVKGLIESIVQEQPDLQDHWGHKNDEKRPQDVDSLSQILHNMTQDQRFVSTYFIVNDVEAIIAHRDSGLLFEPGIDPLKPLVRTRKLTELQRLINKSLKNSQNVKWLLSSCFMPREMTREIELHILKDGQQHLKLDLPNDPNGQWSGLTRKYGSLKIRESCERLQYNLSVSEQEELESQLELPTCYFRAIDIALAVASHRSSKERFVSSLKYLLSSKSSIYGIVQKSFSLLGDLYPDEKDMIFAIINAVFSAARPVPLGDLAAMTAWPYEEAILPSYIKLHLPVLLQIRDDGVWVKHVNILAPGFGKYLPLFACSCLSATFRLLNCDYSEPGDWKKNYSNYNPRIGLATIIWIDFLAELNCGDTDSFYLAKQLLTGRHSLIAWLRELNNRALMADAFRAITQFNNKMDGQVPDKSVGDIMKELATFTSWFLHRSPSEEFQNNLREELLVAEDLPLLRQMLLPGMFPMLRNAPLIQGTSDPCLHLLIRTSSVQGICFSPDGGTFATASDDGYVRVWDTRTGNMLYLLQAFHGPALGVVIHGVLAAFGRRSIKVWNLIQKSLRKTFALPENMVAIDSQGFRSIAISKSGHELAAAVGDKIAIWQIHGSANSPRVVCCGGGQLVTRVLYSITGGRLYAAAEIPGLPICKDPEIVTRNVVGEDIAPSDSPRESESPINKRGHEVGESSQSSKRQMITSTEYKACEETEHVTLEGTESKACYATYAVTVVLPRPRDSEEPNTPSPNSKDEISAISPDSRFLVRSSDHKTARVYDVATHQMLAFLPQHSETSITDLSFSHDGSWIAAGLTNGTIALWVWPMSSGGWKDGYKVGEAPVKPAYLLGKHDGVILSVSFTSGGERNLLASTSADGTMRIWDMQKVRRMMAAGQPPDVELFPNADAKIRLVAISQNGRMVASATYGGDVSLWDIETGLRRCSEKNVIDKPVFMKFSPNNKLLVARSSNGTAIVWAVAVAKHTMTIEPRFTLKHDLALGASTVQAPGVRFDPQGKLLAMGSENNKVHVFDVSNAEPKTGCGHVTKSPSYTFGGGNGHVRGVAFSPDSKLLASCGQDRQGDVKEGSVKIWELGSSSRVLRSSTRVLRPLHRLTSQKQFRADEPCPDYVDVEFTATGDKIISVDAGGRAAIWTPPNETGGQYQYHVVNRIMRTKLIRSIRIDPRFPSYLLTEYGAQKWQFSGEQSGREDAALLSKWLPLDIDMERGRILWKGDRIRCVQASDPLRPSGDIYLPLNLTSPSPFSWWVHENMVVVGWANGHVSVFKFGQPHPSELS